MPGLLFSSYSQSAGRCSVTSAIATVYVAWSLTRRGRVLVPRVSMLTDAPTGAVFAGVGLYITSTILDAIDSIPSGIRNILPTHYVDAGSTCSRRTT